MIKDLLRLKNALETLKRGGYGVGSGKGRRLLATDGSFLLATTILDKLCEGTAREEMPRMRSNQ